MLTSWQSFGFPILDFKIFTLLQIIKYYHFQLKLSKLATSYKASASPKKLYVGLYIALIWFIQNGRPKRKVRSQITEYIDIALFISWDTIWSPLLPSFIYVYSILYHNRQLHITFLERRWLCMRWLDWIALVENDNTF